jgi:Spy/CpxP family protein refolding chaperone
MKRRATIALTVLAVLAALAVPAGAQTERRPMRLLAADALDLTPEQEAKLDELAEAHRASGKDVFDRMDKLRGELDDLTKSPDFDMGKAEKLIDEMSRLRADREKAGLRHRLEMRKVLTPEQLKKLDECRASFGRGGRAGFGRGLGRRLGRLERFPGRAFGLRHLRWRR